MLQYSVAQQMLEKALEISLKIHGKSSKNVADIKLHLARTYWNQGILFLSSIDP